MFKTQPTLALDFTNGQQLDPRIKFSRSSSATRVNKFGVLETVTANVPRFDYEPADVLASSVEYATGNWAAPAGYDPTVVTVGSTVTSTGATTANRCAILLQEMIPGGEYTLQITVNSKANGDPSIFIRDGATLGAGTTIYTASLMELRKYSLSFSALTKNVNLLIASADPTSSFSCTVSVTATAKYLKRKGECRGLLIEGQRTNLVRNSTNVGAVVGVLGSGGALPTNWVKSGGTGLNFEVTSVGTQSGIPYFSLTVTGTPSENGAYLYIDGIGSATDLSSDQAVSSSAWLSLNKSIPNSGLSSIIFGAEERTATSYLKRTVSKTFDADTPFPLDLTRVQMTGTTAAGAAKGGSFIYFGTTIGAPVNFVIRIGGAQFEIGPSASSFIPTQSGQVTRNADQASVQSADWYNPNEGTFVLSGYGGSIAGIWPGVFDCYYDASNRMSAYIDNASTSWQFRKRNGGVNQSITSFATVAGPAKFSVAATYSSGKIAIAASGTQGRSTDSTGVPSGQLSSLKIGVADEFLYGHVRSLTYLPAELSLFELKEISKAP